jgi:putative transcriptional regulator
MKTEITHHLTPQLLMAYSAGTLPEAFDLIVASHLSLCDACRAEAESYDAVGGALMEGETSEMSAGSLEATLRMIRESGAAEADAPCAAAPPATAELPRPIRDYIGGDLGDVRWQGMGMGVRQAILPVDGPATARLLHIPAGAEVPDHGHKGTELTLVLKGAFRDEDGRFGPGDVEVADEAVEHTPVAEEGEDCICLAVTDAPLRFAGLMPRLAQPFLKI